MLNFRDRSLRIISTGFNANSRLFIEENFCPFVLKIGYMCRQLKRADIIFSTWMGRDWVHIKVREGDRPEVINHPEDLTSSYPDYDFS